MRMGAKGIKVRCAGRLGGAEIARVETLPRRQRASAHAARRHRLRRGHRARPPYGAIGVKVWICKGEIFPAEFKESLRKQVVEQRA